MNGWLNGSIYITRWTHELKHMDRLQFTLHLGYLVSLEVDGVFPDLYVGNNFAQMYIVEHDVHIYA